MLLSQLLVQLLGTQSGLKSAVGTLTEADSGIDQLLQHDVLRPIKSMVTSAPGMGLTSPSLQMDYADQDDGQEQGMEH